ncbi:MAG: hypothetical protein ACREXT_09160, partial [Gammaproteobacteria bacterium]
DTAVAEVPTESRGGWMMVSRVVPTHTQTNPTAAPTVVAAEARRGGWMVQAAYGPEVTGTSSVARAASAASTAAGTEARRGGWMIQAAYGLNEGEEQRRNQFTHFHLTA